MVNVNPFETIYWFDTAEHDVASVVTASRLSKRRAEAMSAEMTLDEALAAVSVRCFLPCV